MERKQGGEIGGEARQMQQSGATPGSHGKYRLPPHAASVAAAAAAFPNTFLLLLLLLLLVFHSLPCCACGSAALTLS